MVRVTAAAPILVTGRLVTASRAVDDGARAGSFLLTGSATPAAADG